MDVRKWLVETEAPRLRRSSPSSSVGNVSVDGTPAPYAGRMFAAQTHRPKRCKTHHLAKPVKPGQSEQTHGKRRRVERPASDSAAETASSHDNAKGAKKRAKLQVDNGRRSSSLPSSAATNRSSDLAASEPRRPSPESSVAEFVEPKYERRARRKTREDCYVLKDDKQSRRLKPTDAPARRREGRKKSARRGKTSEALVHSFAASNVAQDRLTVGAVPNRHRFTGLVLILLLLTLIEGTAKH